MPNLAILHIQWQNIAICKSVAIFINASIWERQQKLARGLQASA